ncbi:FMRFamide-activated amiloride-sensitive sodium channel-like [Argiope bruennichi]|uniref:FMRFamide-activated amiloride-sensitive sodium channel-like n=1 Tax=Argiope bruennichi TaxID=94029 RepID=UPI0024949FA9|nr:FMRFamide-activated amiloride-sensitive sodium channel-like [Argiope bruennichi]
MNSGLALTLYLMTVGYQSTVHTFGAKIVIHDPNQTPNPEDEGLFINPGHDTLISLKQTLYRRLSHPYPDGCKDYDADISSKIRTKNDCIRACIQMESYEKCDCIDPSLGITSNFRPCNLSNAKESCCLNEVLDAMARSASPCDCPLPCVSLYYNEQISRSRLVSRDRLTRWFLQNDKVMIKVFYSSKERLVYDQMPKWKGSELFSHIGNELSLWLGISVLTAFELLEKLILFTKNVCLLNRK